MVAFYAKRILVVEDDAGTRQMLSKRLESWGFRVLTEQSGEKALETVALHPVDLVILDVHLPDMSGLEVCTQFRRSKGPWLPVLMLTGMDRPKDRLNGFGHGADAYLTKPYKPEELLKTIEFLLGSALAPVTEDKEHFLSIEDVARRFDVNITTIYRLAQKGRLPGFKVGSQWRFSSQALDTWTFAKGTKGEKHDR